MLESPDSIHASDAPTSLRYDPQPRKAHGRDKANPGYLENLMRPGVQQPLCRRAHGFGDMNRIERNISYDAGIVPHFNGGKIVDPVDADHNQRALISVYTKFHHYVEREEMPCSTLFHISSLVKLFLPLNWASA